MDGPFNFDLKKNQLTLSLHCLSGHHLKMTSESAKLEIIKAFSPLRMSM